MSSSRLSVLATMEFGDSNGFWRGLAVEDAGVAEEKEEVTVERVDGVRAFT